MDRKKGALKKLETEILQSCLNLGLDDPKRAVLLGTNLYLWLGFFVGQLFFNGSQIPALIGFVFGLVWGLLFPDFISERLRQRQVSLVWGSKGEEEAYPEA